MPKPKRIKVTKRPPERFVIAFKAHDYLNVATTRAYEMATEEQVYIKRGLHFYKVAHAKTKVVDFKEVT